MAKDSNLDLIRGNYARQSDQELIRIISQEAHGLTTEAVQVIKEELAKRNLDAKLTQVVEVQNRNFSGEELDDLARFVETLICPVCHKYTQPLTAAVISQTMSFVIMTQYSNKLHIACPDCLKSECNSSIGITLLLGWWGFPWGPIRSVQSLVNNFKAYSAINHHGPNDYLQGFILANIGLFELHKNSRENIQNILHNLHKNLPLNTDI